MKSRWTIIRVGIILCTVILSMTRSSIVHGQAGFSGGTYTENFDTLASSGTSSTVPTGWAFSESGTNANTTYNTGTGSNNDGDTYSFGASGSTERAFGGLRSGSLIPLIGVQFQNNTGRTIGSLDISYYCEQWRIGVDNRGAADRLDFQYSTDATSLTTGNWTEFDTLDCLSTVTSGTHGALNGNTNRTQVSATITGLSISDGSTFWFRWIDFDISSSDDGLAIDDFSMSAETPTAITLRTLSASSVPLSPPAVALPLLGLAAFGGGLLAYRRRAVKS